MNVLYCHGPDKITPIEEQAAAFDAQYRKGRFAYLGVSNLSPEMLVEWLDVADAKGYVKPSYYQGQYNLITRTHEDNLMPLLRAHGIHYVVFSPLAHGILAGRSPEGMQGPFVFYDTPAVVNALANIRQAASNAGLSMEGASLRWLAHHSALGEGDGIILGASKPAQIEASAAEIAKGPLPDSVAKELSGLWEPARAEVHKVAHHGN